MSRRVQLTKQKQVTRKASRRAALVTQAARRFLERAP